MTDILKSIEEKKIQWSSQEPHKSIKLFGCSHLAALYKAVDDKHGSNFTHQIFEQNTGVIGGNSNHKIIEDVYRYVNGYQMEPKFCGINSDALLYSNPPLDDLTNSIVYIQCTYTNRLWLPTTLNSYTSSFHSLATNSGLLYMNNKIFQEELIRFYGLYIKFFWNHYLNLLDLLQKIDMLQIYLKSKNIKFIQTFWSFGGHTPEWRELSEAVISKERDLSDIKKQIDDILKRIEYVKPDGYDTIDEYLLNHTSTLQENQKYVDGVHWKSKYYEKVFNEIIYPKYLELS